MDSTEIAELFKQKRIRPTAQRMDIYASLLARKDHPTVEMLYAELLPSHPAMSKTTVYNTLEALVDARLVRTISIDKTEARYDADTRFHGHFRCIRCHRVTDFQLPDPEGAVPELKNARILTRDVFYTGLCRDCEK